MCYQVKCSKCGKTSWAGCGLHVRSVYEKVPQGQHCVCKSWPGVRIQPGGGQATAEPVEAGSSSTSSSSGYCSTM